MSKMKKVISLVLCIAMLAGTFTFLGDLIAPAASAAEGSNVKTYAELDAQYDKFVYVGIDVIEVANGELTDGYVQPGDWLEYHMTVLSDMYISTSYPHLAYTKDFFDCRVVTSMNKPDHDNYGNNDYEGNLKFTDGTLMNPDHPYAAPNVATYHTLTALPATKVATQMGFCEIDETTYSNWDFVKSNIGITTTTWNSNFPMTTDTWWTMWYVRVKDGLADGKQGQSFSPASIWKNQINPATGKGDTRRLADVYTGDSQGVASASLTMGSRYNVITLLLDDTYHTFTIGEGEVVEKKIVTFQMVDGTVIASGEYAEGDTVEVPAVEGLVTWTEATKAVELGESFTMGIKNLTYVAVVDTDEFNVTINLNGGEYTEDAALPEGAEVVDGKLIVKAGFGETVDLTAFPVPEKEGYTGTWTPATVKVESTRGANASITWAKATFTAKFYLDKEAYESGAASVRDVTFVYGNKVPFDNVNVNNLKNDKKFVGWIDAATGEAANKEELFADNMSFYADWTDYDSTVTVWGRDYANDGEWKAITTLYGDSGTSVTLNSLKALVTEANYGVGNVEYNVAGSESTFSDATAIRTDFAFDGTNKNVYIYTTIKFDVAIKSPVFNEEGYITEEFTTETKAPLTSSTEEDKLTTSNLLLTAPTQTYPGYKFVAWVDAEGNEYPATGAVTLDTANATEYTFTAKYEEIEYTIAFNTDYGSSFKNLLTVEGKFKVGDTFTLSEKAVFAADGSETTLPEIGKENKEQAAGPYMNRDGYKFAGWKTGTTSASLVDYDITQEVTLTPAVLSQVTFNETIEIKGMWEALSYDFVAYYATEFDAEGKPVYQAMPAVQVATNALLTDVIAAAGETAKLNLPEGKILSQWKLADGSIVPGKMPAYGIEIYATYTGESLDLYVDYNNGKEDCIKLSLEFTRYLKNGVDVENDIPADQLAPIARLVKTATIAETDTPGSNYEIVGWKVYHVENPADVKDRTKWHEGVNHDNTSIAKYTLIYQIEWLKHTDFLFRLYNTDSELYLAVGKDFTTYYYKNGRPVADKESAVVFNHLPDRLMIIGILPKLAGFDYNRFFEADMWSNLSIRIDPLTFSKAWLDPGNWGALLEALWNGITSGFGGAI